MGREFLPLAAAIFVAACGQERTVESVADGAAPFIAAQAASSPSSGGTARPGSTKLPAGVFEVSKVTLIDPSGFEKPLPAATILAPAGWTFSGGVVWGPFRQCGPDYALSYSLRSPDGASAVTVAPAVGWFASRANFQVEAPQSGCEPAGYLSVRDYLTASAGRLFPGARVLDYRPLPEETKPLNDIIGGAPAMPPTPGLDQRMFVDAGEALVGYQKDGREMRAAISAMAIIQQMRMADMMDPSQVSLETVSGTPLQLTVVTAPDGALDLGLRTRIGKSMRQAPEWSQRIAAYQAEKSRGAMKASAAAHAARMDAIRKQGDIINGLYNDRMLMSDRNQREFIEGVRGVETYSDPVAGAPVQLDNAYSNAFRVRDSETYLMTNDPSFDPGRYGVDAQRLEVVQ